MHNFFPEEAVEEDGWYEQALKEGYGFKSEQERNDYIKSLGDPMDHPLFCTSTEELEESKSPLIGAFRALQEEDKTPTELASMYKEEGNHFFGEARKLAVGGKVTKDNNEKYKKRLHDAHNCYTHAFTFLPVADATTDEQVTVLVQLLSNRAQISLDLSNYRSCILDCDAAMGLMTSHPASTASIISMASKQKIHFRKCKALVSVRRWRDCIHSCITAEEDLKGDPSQLKPFVQWREQCQGELQRRRDGVAKERQRKVDRWTAQFQAARNVSATLGHFLTFAALPPVLKTASSPRVGEDWSVSVSVLLQYPQYDRSDCIQEANEKDLLVEHLAELFPLFEDGRGALEWDRSSEYEVSTLAVYVRRYRFADEGQVNCKDVACETLEEWLSSCEEQWIIEEGAKMIEEEGSEESDKVTVSRKQSYDLAMSSVLAREKRVGRVGVSEYYELHMECSIKKITSAEGVVLSGGVLRLVVFPRDGPAREAFVQQTIRDSGKDAIQQLLP